MRVKDPQAGLTYLEWAILVAVIGIVTALAWPYFQLLQEKTREMLTQQNIAAIKSAISIYYGDHEGIWPTTLEVNDRTPGWGFGDYLPVMPKVLATHPVDPAVSPAGNQVTLKSFSAEPSLAKPETAGQGWRYDGPGQGNTGRIWINSTFTDTNGIPYSRYGYQE